jgi:fatty acid desaturase
MSRLFLQGIPTAFIFVPLAILIMGRARAGADEPPSPAILPMSWKEWLRKLGLIYLAYLALYYLAGYFIAWQNPEVRAFYGSPGDARPFFQQMAYIFTNDPWLTPYQLLRTFIWVAGVYPIIHGSRLPRWQTALIVGLAVSVPQNVGHLLPNSLIPLNTVRISHMIETASSTFVFGLIVTWLLYPKYSIKKP